MAIFDTLMLAGDYDVSVADRSLRAGPAGGAGLSVDFLGLSPLQLGAQALVFQRDSHDAQLSPSTLTHLGAHVGAAFVPRADLMLGAALLVGAQTLDFDDADTLTTGLGLGLVGDVGVRLYGALWLRGQVGLLWQPIGGNDATDVTMPPTPFFGLGTALALPAPSR